MAVLILFDMKRTIFFLSLFLTALALPAQTSDNENPISTINETPGLCSIFHSWGFIGDSLSSGEHEYHKEDGSLGYLDLYDYSWGTRMCKAMGVEGEIYAQGGETAQGWIKNFWESPRNGNNNIDAKASPKQAYVIALGANETFRNLPVGSVATDVDTADYRNNAETFAGSYAGIIQRVKSIAPDAKFFVVTRPRESVTDDKYNEVVRQMADIFKNVYVIDLYKYAPDYDDPAIRNNYFLGGHLTAAGYQWTAWMMMTYIDNIIRNNLHDFDQAAFINTPYSY